MSIYREIKARLKAKSYEARKIRKIKRLAKQYSVLDNGPHSFETGTPADRSILELKQDLLSKRITMLGNMKIDTLRYCAETCIKDGVSGDFIETGVWNGGATIFLAGVLRAHCVEDRKVFVADSFEGLPPPEEDKWPVDKGDDHFTRPELAVSLEKVKNNFKSYDLLSDQVVFIKGFFEESLPNADIQNLSILRLDGDMYGSTMAVLQALYHKLEVGGFLILDDWLLRGARSALLDFRGHMNVTEPFLQDQSGIYFRKTSVTPPLSFQEAHEIAGKHGGGP